MSSFISSQNLHIITAVVALTYIVLSRYYYSSENKDCLSGIKTFVDVLYVASIILLVLSLITSMSSKSFVRKGFQQIRDIATPILNMLTPSDEISL